MIAYILLVAAILLLTGGLWIIKVRSEAEERDWRAQQLRLAISAAEARDIKHREALAQRIHHERHHGINEEMLRRLDEVNRRSSGERSGE